MNLFLRTLPGPRRAQPGQLARRPGTREASQLETPADQTTTDCHSKPTARLIDTLTLLQPSAEDQDNLETTLAAGRRQLPRNENTVAPAGLSHILDSHAITNPRLSHDAPGPAGASAQLPPEPLHHIPHQPRIAHTLRAPHPLQQHVVRQHPRRVHRQLVDHRILRARQIHQPPANGDLSLREVNAHVSEPKRYRRLARSRLHPLPQRGMDPGRQFRR